VLCDVESEGCWCNLYPPYVMMQQSEHCLTTLPASQVEGPVNASEPVELCVGDLAVATFKRRSPEGCGFNEFTDACLLQRQTLSAILCVRRRP